MIEVSKTISLEEREVQFTFIRASGPGGQNVNKVATAVQLRFDIKNSPSLQDDVKTRLIGLAGSRVTEEGVLVLEAKRHRTQEQNRFVALARLKEMIRKAANPPKKRKPTRPSGASRAKRLRAKRNKAQIKKLRRLNPEDLE